MKKGLFILIENKCIQKREYKNMKRLLCSMVFLSLILPAGLSAQEENGKQEELSELQVTLQEYREEGYEMLGPLQYLGKTRDKIKFYKN
ncbi:MAG: hypothetical protein R6T96_14760, partial [Longimicrobiales bacterium]